MLHCLGQYRLLWYRLLLISLLPGEGGNQDPSQGQGRIFAEEWIAMNQRLGIAS